MRTIAFSVLGKAMTKGSWTPVPTQDGRIFLKPRTQSKPWERLVAWHGRQAMAGQPLCAGPVRLELEFYFVRPACHYGTGRNATTLRADAPLAPTSQHVGDGDKLERAICDALTGVAYVDDKLVVRVLKEKFYGPRNETLILVADWTPRQSSSRPTAGAEGPR